MSTSDLSIDRWDQLNTTASNSQLSEQYSIGAFLYIYQRRLLCWADNFSSLFTMLTELTRVDLSSDSYYSYEDMGPSSSLSPLSSDSAFGDQLTCSVELVSVHYYQYNWDWALGRGLRKRRSGDKIRQILLRLTVSILILIFNIIRSPILEKKNRWPGGWGSFF